MLGEAPHLFFPLNRFAFGFSPALSYHIMRCFSPLLYVSHIILMLFTLTKASNIIWLINKLVLNCLICISGLNKNWQDVRLQSVTSGRDYSIYLVYYIFLLYKYGYYMQNWLCVRRERYNTRSIQEKLTSSG